jgi:hypothetical protein
MLFFVMDLLCIQRSELLDEAMIWPEMANVL